MRIILFIISFVILSTLSIVYVGWFPVASVNSDWIWQRDMKKGAGAVAQLQRVSPGANVPSRVGTTTLSALSASDIRRGVLEELIREKIVAQELTRVDSAQDWNQRIARDAEGLLSGRDKAALEEATRKLYALNLNDFGRLVLAPQIREELLRKELALRAEDPDAWLENAFTNAAIKIYFLDYAWQKGRLVEN
jgi:hypothetical protein